MKKIALLILSSLFILGINAQVTVDNTSQSVEQWVQNVLAGPGVVISNVTFNGSAAAAAIPNEQIGSFTDGSSDVGLSNGIILGSGDVTMATQLNTGGGSNLGGSGNQGVDLDLAAITTSDIWDECVIEFDFVPQGDTISFNYVFASEEYEENACGSVNDAFGFFISGPNPDGGNYNAKNIALVPDPLNPNTFTTTPVSINTINQGTSGTTNIFDETPCADVDPNWDSYSQFYTPNNVNTYEYDGRTVVLQAVAHVNCDDTYHIKLAIGDGGDGVFDSGVFLEAYSFSSSPAIAIDFSTPTVGGDSIIIEGCTDAVLNLTRTDATSDTTIHFVIGGTATMDGPGVLNPDYLEIADSVTFLAGEGRPLNA